MRQAARKGSEGCAEASHFQVGQEGGSSEERGRRKGKKKRKSESDDCFP
jgi:hypothetical protein